HMARQRPSIDVISPAGAIADVKIDALSLVEVRRALRVSVRNRDQRQNRGGADNCHNTHVILPLRPGDDASSHRRDVAFDQTGEPDWAGATLGRTASACLGDSLPLL